MKNVCLLLLAMRRAFDLAYANSPFVRKIASLATALTLVAITEAILFALVVIC